MAVLVGFAFVSGIITILSPCILPVLPVVLAAGAGRGRARPLGVMAGFVASFSFFTLALTALVQLLGVPADALRYAAVALIVLSGLVMLVPRLRVVFESLASRIANRGARVQARTTGQGSGFAGGIPVGLGLGLIWTPCVGPIMASVISLALTQRVDGGAVLITLAYTVGTSIPMFGVMMGGRALLGKLKGLTRGGGRIQQVFGALMIVVGVGVGLGWDRKLQTAILSVLPGYGAGITAVENAGIVKQALTAREAKSAPRGPAMEGAAGRAFSGVRDSAPLQGRTGDFGAAPEIVTNGRWFNIQGSALEGATGSGAGRPSMQDLRGNVVIVDFWTYSCVNCVRTMPYLRAWYEAYRDKGLVIIGVHTPEFEFEKSAPNVQRALTDLGVSWPVVQDNDFAQWTAYGNRYWPAHYFIDAQGRVRYYHFGEGEYDVSEKILRELLREAGSSVSGAVSVREKQIEARTPETYLGFFRAERLVSEERPAPDAVTDFHSGRAPGNGEWSLSGRWTVTGEYVVPESAGTLELGFQARDVFLVVEPESTGARIAVRVDGVAPRDTGDLHGGVVIPTESRLYHLVSLDRAGSHTLRLDVTGRIRLYAFTFG